MEDNPLDLKTKQPITVDTRATLKAMQIRNPSEALKNVVEDHYKTKEKQEKDDGTDWQSRINIGNPLETHKLKLLQRVNMFSAMSDGNLGTIRAKQQRI